MHRFCVFSVLARPLAVASSALSLALATAPGTSAATGDRAPADAPPISASVAGRVLVGWQEHGMNCMTARRTPEADPGEESEVASCQRPTPLLPLGHQVAGWGFQPLDPMAAHAEAVLYGVTGTGVATVELDVAGRALLRVATSPAPVFGDARGFLFVTKDPEDPRTGRERHAELRYFDASGTLRRVEDVAGSSATGDEREVLVARGRRGPQTWRLSGWSASVLQPSPLDPARRAERLCLGVRLAGEPPDQLCDRPGSAGDEPPPLTVSSLPGCRGIGLALPVLVRAPAARARAVLGDGRLLRVPLWDTGRLEPGSRAGLLILPPGVAVRRVEGLDAAGRIVAVVGARLAPGQRRCSANRDGMLVAALSRPPERSPSAEPHAVVAEERGDALCVGLDALDATGGPCAVPPADPAIAALDVTPTADGGGVLTGLVPAEVVAARLRLAGGSDVVAQAVPLPGYVGRYAAATRLVRADLAPGARTVAIELLDARGRVVLQRDGIGAPSLRAVTQVLASQAGRPAVMAGVVPRGVSRPEAGHCAGLAPLLDTSSCLILGGAEYAVAEVSCKPRRVVVLSLLEHRGDHLRLTLRGGRIIRGRVARAPRGFGAAAIGVAAAPAGAALRGVTVHGSQRRTWDVHLPAPSAQCGYVRYLGSTVRYEPLSATPVHRHA